LYIIIMKKDGTLYDPHPNQLAEKKKKKLVQKDIMESKKGRGLGPKKTKRESVQLFP